MTNDNILVIGGGVGPEAGTLLHRKIIQMTDNGILKDQGHANVLHLSFSQYVADRTKFLLQQEGKNPGTSMAEVMGLVAGRAAQMGRNLVVGVPCNTFHSKKVYDDFTAHFTAPNILHLNMIELVTKYFQMKEDVENILLLSTEGTQKTEVYSSMFSPIYRERFIECEKYEMKQVMNAIYGERKGIKSANPDYLQAVDSFEAAITNTCRDRDLRRLHVIMGCTEIPLAYDQIMNKDLNHKLALPRANYVDPMDILAANMIVAAGYPLKPIYREFVVGGMDRPLRAKL